MEYIPLKRTILKFFTYITKVKHGILGYAKEAHARHPGWFEETLLHYFYRLLQRFIAGVYCSGLLQGFIAAVYCRCLLQGFIAGVYCRGLLQGFIAGVYCRGLLQGFIAGVYCRGILQGYIVLVTIFVQRLLIP